MEKLIFLILVLILGCMKEPQRVKPDNFIEREIVLKDFSYNEKNKFFAKINLFAPIEFDTLQIWTDASDCSGCETYKYRLTTSESCLIQESGFYHIAYCKDSINRLTIEHTKIGIENVNIDSTFLKNVAELIISSCHVTIYENKIEKINGMDFSITRYSRCHRSEYSNVATLLASTSLSGTLIHFRFECIQNDCSNFEAKSLSTIKSVLIDTIPR